jgi:hypothetical protein
LIERVDDVEGRGKSGDRVAALLDASFVEISQKPPTSAR